MIAGDFLEIAQSRASSFDCIVTAWFIDTAKNIIDYIGNGSRSCSYVLFVLCIRHFTTQVAEKRSKKFRTNFVKAFVWGADHGHVVFFGTSADYDRYG